MAGDTLDVGHLEMAEVLRRLYNASVPLGMGVLHFKGEDMTLEQAQTIIDERVEWAAKQDRPSFTSQEVANMVRQALYFDYLLGRVMKIDLSERRALDVRLYDRDNGPGAAARALGIDQIERDTRKGNT